MEHYYILKSESRQWKIYSWIFHSHWGVSWPRSHSLEASEPRADSKFCVWGTFAHPWNGPRWAQRSQLPQDWLKEQLHHLTTALGMCIHKAGWGREISVFFPCQSTWPATAWYVHCIINFKVTEHCFHRGVFFFPIHLLSWIMKPITTTTVQQRVISSSIRACFDCIHSQKSSSAIWRPSSLIHLPESQWN